VSSAVAFGLVAAISSQISKAWTRSAIAAIHGMGHNESRVGVVVLLNMDAWDLCNISFMDVVVLLNVSFMDAVNDSIMCIISLNCLSVTKLLSSSSGS
jgi:hypothetical protein